MSARALAALALAFLLPACATLDPDIARRADMNQAIHAEPKGDYFMGRRMYKQDYKMWGWVREPGKPWKSAKLVMFNEQQSLAPDRARDQIGSDNNYEYRLRGYFSGQTVYEPASDGFYPEFVLTGYEVVSTNPPSIYQTKRQNQPAVRILQAPVY